MEPRATVLSRESVRAIYEYGERRRRVLGIPINNVFLALSTLGVVFGFAGFVTTLVALLTRNNAPCPTSA
jgi:hypothetical protein